MSTKQIALVTGANRGLGLGTSRSLAQKGFHVIMVGRDRSKIEAAARGLQNDGLSVEPFSADVGDEGSISELASFVERQHGRLDILVNNAGVFLESSGDFHPQTASALVIPCETVAKTFEINTLGPLRVSQKLVPLMKETGGGRIVNVSSGMGQLSEMNGSWPGYRLSKTALNALTRILSEELKDSRIKVNSVCPGWVRTDMGGSQAHRTIEEGVSGIVWAATLPDSGPTGGFFRDGKSIAW